MEEQKDAHLIPAYMYFSHEPCGVLPPHAMKLDCALLT